LATQAESLQEMVSFFKIEENAVDTNTRTAKGEKYPAGKRIQTPHTPVKKYNGEGRSAGRSAEKSAGSVHNNVHIELEEFEKF